MNERLVDFRFAIWRDGSPTQAVNRGPRIVAAARQSAAMIYPPKPTRRSDERRYRGK